ncbi:MAG: hypothetical protein ACOY93_17205 [Bacillota bacterium]
MVRRLWPALLAGLLMAGSGCARPDAPPGPAAEAAGQALAAPAQTALQGAERIPLDWVPELKEVATLHLSLGMPVPLEEAPLPLHATHPRHRERIALLLDMLSDARLVPGEISLPARAPSLQIALTDGTTVSARLAYDCTPFTSETGHGYTCRQAAGELILHTRQGREVRVANPRTARWLTGGWREDIPVGRAPDMDKETALEIARQTDARAAWRATFYEEYPVEGKGGITVHRAWVLEAEFPSGSKTRLVIDAQTGGVLRVAQLEALQ